MPTPIRTVANTTPTRNITNTTLANEIAELVATASPFVRVFAQKIMELYDEQSVATTLTVNQQRIQTVFEKFPNDEVTRRLAQLTVALTDFAPKIAATSSGYPIGSLIKYNDVVYVVIHLNGSTNYSINSKATAYHSFSTAAVLKTDPIYGTVTKTEAGLFAKEFLSVSSTTLFTYISTTLGNNALPIFIKAVDPESYL